MSRSWTENLTSPAALLRFVGVCALGLVLDLWTKWLAQTHLAPTSASVHFIPGWLHFEWTTNRGAVFGLGQGQVVLFVAVSIGAIAFLAYLFAVSGRQPLYQIILAMLLAGGLGNMYDRIAFGYVRDMIHALPRWPKLFPWIFNVADSMLCVGVFLMIVYSMAHRHAPKSDLEPQLNAEARG